jgi:putative heme-binding domain-containing protein
VRVYLASALQRVDRTASWKMAGELMMHGEDATDHNLPKMLWAGVEPLVKENPAFALERAAQSSIPLLARFIARRTVDADALEPLVAAIGRAPKTERSLLEGMRDGLEGRVDLAAPSNWAAVFDRLKRSDAATARLALDVAQQFGDTETARRNLADVRSRTASVEQRRKALQMLTAQRRLQLVPVLHAALDDRGLRVDVIRSIAAFDDEPLGKALVERYSTFSGAEKAEAVQTLASRRRYGRLLTEALASGVIPRRDVPSYVARQLLRVMGAGFTDVWGPVEQSPNEERASARYRGLLTDSAISGANVKNGRTAFQRTCGPCHKMYGEGGMMGPDLTGSNRANLEYLLFNVLNPNGEVQDDYKMVVITTRDGRTFSGNVAAETPRQITLRVVGRDPAVINKSDIQSRELTAVSMMPPGLFETLTDREVIDLVAYLRTVEQVKP